MVPYSTYYKPMGDLLYISSEQEVGLYTNYHNSELPAEEGGGLIIHHGLIIHTIWYSQEVRACNCMKGAS